MKSTMRALTHAGPALRRRLKPSPVARPTPSATMAYGPKPKQQLDVYVPASADNAPSALIVHGGGFIGGNRRMPAVACLVSDLLQQGHVVASLSYRPVRPWGGALDHQEEDVGLAARWWTDHAKDFGGDIDRNALIGLSAGGALALLAVPAARFDRFVGIYGAYDFALLPAPKVSSSLLTRSRDPATHAARSPLTRGDFPQPALLVHGTLDPLTPPEQASRLHAHRVALGLPSELVWVEGATHGFLMDGPDDPYVIEALAAIRRFLVRP